MRQISLVSARRSVLFTLFSAAIALTVLINGCVMGQATPKTLKVGITTWPGFDVVLYAKDAGLFKQRGLEVELMRFDNQQDSSRAVMRGTLDAAFVSLGDVMQVDPGNDKPVFVMATNISHGADGIVTQGAIKSIEDLKGKRVAAKLGTVNHLILLEALKLHGVKPEQVAIEDISNDNAAQMMRDQKIDGAVLWQPLLGEVAKDIQGHVVHTTADLESLIIDGLISRDEVIQTKSDEFKQFVLAWLDLMQAIDQKPDDVYSLVSQQLGQSKESFASDYAGLQKGDLAMQDRLFKQGGIRDAAQAITQLLEADPRHGRVARQDVEFNAEPVIAAMEAWKS